MHLVGVDHVCRTKLVEEKLLKLTGVISVEHVNNGGTNSGEESGPGTSELFWVKSSVSVHVEVLEMHADVSRGKVRDYIKNG